jgi:hypothetical protein
MRDGRLVIFHTLLEQVRDSDIDKDKFFASLQALLLDSGVCSVDDLSRVSDAYYSLQESFQAYIEAGLSEEAALAASRKDNVSSCEILRLN